jgi:hypothetical protein
MEWSKHMGKLGPNSWAEEKRMLGPVIPEMQRGHARGRVRRVDPYSSSLITRGRCGNGSSGKGRRKNGREEPRSAPSPYRKVEMMRKGGRGRGICRALYGFGFPTNRRVINWVVRGVI